MVYISAEQREKLNVLKQGHGDKELGQETLTIMQSPSFDSNVSIHYFPLIKSVLSTFLLEQNLFG